MDFHKFLEISVKNSYFIFNSELYEQIDGVAMGSPLGPILANIFMCHLEEKIFNNNNLAYKPKFYRRFVDDTFAVFENTNQAELFLTFINNLHKNIKFTVEIEKDNCLPFLDILNTYL